MKFIVFEAGSRAGFSAEMFFLAWQKQHPNNELILADADNAYSTIPAPSHIHRVSEDDGISMLSTDNDIIIFPGDELTRQSKPLVANVAIKQPFATIFPQLYNKKYVNETLLSALGENTPIRIPKTFNCVDVFLKPNVMSAGSKGLMRQSNVCVSEYIHIKKEYVADILENDGTLQIFVREVTLRSGYDKMVKLLPQNHPIAMAISDFLIQIYATNILVPLFQGIFHIQIAEDENHQLYYIEASRRISGTSIVNIFRGFNPFSHILGERGSMYVNRFEYNTWYRYEDFLVELKKVI